VSSTLALQALASKFFGVSSTLSSYASSSVGLGQRHGGEGARGLCGGVKMCS